MKKDSVGYLNTRKNSDFEYQKSVLENYCKYKFAILEYFHDDRESSKSPGKRPLYREMLEYCTRHEIENIIIYNLSEFSSNPEQGLNELESLTTAGFAVYCAENDFIGNEGNPEDRRNAITSFLSFMNQYRTNAEKLYAAKYSRDNQSRSSGRPNALNKGQREALIAVRRAGTSISQICRMFNVSRSTVSKVLADYPELKGTWRGGDPGSPSRR
jgi:DNA invertase Pin-like site-specific DNA recombinase